MNRKNTILIAVLINAGLLVVLFIGGLWTQEEGVPNHAEVSSLQIPEQNESPTPLFNAELPPIKLPEAPLALAPEPPVVHQLPPVVSVEPVPVQPPVEVQKSVVVNEAPSVREITVKQGDSLEKIAKAEGVSVDEIIKLNRLPSSFLRIGQKLKLPPPSSVAAAPNNKSADKKEATSEYYVVKVGDNPWTIALKNQLKVDELLRLNSLNEERARKLKPGDRLRIR